MNYRFYNDARKNYLVIACSEAAETSERRSPNRENPGWFGGSGAAPFPERDSTQSGLADYQYQMVAANHIAGLVPCSLRRINNELFLYLDITSLQSIGSLFQNRRMNAGMQKRILYSLTDAGDSIARYLLDSRNILMDPRFVFYSQAAGTCCFVYYPGERTTDYATLFRFMADRADPMDRKTSGVILRLCELAENENFILDSTLLDRLYAEEGREDTRRESEPAYRENVYSNVQNNAWDEPYAAYDQPDGGYDERSGGVWELYRAPQKETWTSKTQAAEHKVIRTEAPLTEEEPEENSREAKLSHVLIGAFIFLVAAVGGEVLHIHFNLKEGFDLAARVIAAAGAGGCVMLACYGVILVWKERRVSSDEEGRNVLPGEPAVDFRRSQLAGGIKTGSRSNDRQLREEREESRNVMAERYTAGVSGNFSAGDSQGYRRGENGRGHRNVVSYSLYSQTQDRNMV